MNSSRGGVPKQPVFEGRISSLGLEGDVQNDLRYHGGPDRALVLFSLDVIRMLQAEGHSVVAGSAGENLTISGVAWAAIAPGTRLSIGDATLEIASYTSPCSKLSALFLDGNFTRISQKVHPGFSRLSARVLKGGTVRAGDVVTVEEGPEGTRPVSAPALTAAAPVP